VIPASSTDLFAATAGTAGALTGLLFVALSVAPRGGPLSVPPVIRQIRAAAAILAFTNALAVSLFSLVPGTNSGYPAVVMGVIGLFFTAAAIRSIRSSRDAKPQQGRQYELMGLLFLIFGAELVGGAALIADPRSEGWLQIIGYAIVASLIVGVARAWELVGDRDTGIRASIAVLTGRESSPDDK
jgi:NADH:ubiquinone oxidoreductase subunit 3 (subunit A)